MECRLCGGHDLRREFEGSIRAGAHGKYTPQDVQVMFCGACQVAFLNPFEVIEYEDGSYRLDYNQTDDLKTYFAAHDPLQARYLAKLSGETSFRNKIVADFGAGGGAFLDFVRGVARRTVGIEPHGRFREELSRRGHQAYSSTDEFLADGNAHTIDVAVSFHVIEHSPDPVMYLRQINSSLAPSGVAYILTPNSDDLLMAIGGTAYRQFNYRTAHLWYFNRASLNAAAILAGFQNATFAYTHSYDISNAIGWLREGRPTGNGTFEVFDDRINAAWTSFLEHTGKADTIWMRLSNVS